MEEITLAHWKKLYGVAGVAGAGWSLTVAALVLVLQDGPGDIRVTSSDHPEMTLLGAALALGGPCWSERTTGTGQWPETAGYSLVAEAPVTLSSWWSGSRR